MILLNRLFILFGLVVAITSCDNNQKIESYKYNQNMVLSGVVDSSPIKDSDGLEFDFYTQKYGKILLKSDKRISRYIVPANKLQLTAKIFKPHEFDNTNAFNYAEFLEHKNIVAVGRVATGVKIDYQGTAISYLPKRLRYNLANYLDNSLDGYKSKPMVLALLIGQKNFDEQEKALFIDSGTSHLMVISGLHIGLFALIAFVMARILWSLSPRLCRKAPAQYVAVIFSILAAFLYSLLAGFSLPTQRAVIMVLVIGVFWLAKKKVPVTHSLVIAFVIIVMLDWQSIYSTSLWLSFSAVFFLVIIATILQQYKSKFTSNFLAQFYLTLFLIPISVYFFGGFSLVSFIANIVAIPLVSLFIVPMLLLCLMLSFIGINIWAVPDLLLNFLTDYLKFLVSNVNLVEYWSYFSFSSLIIALLGISLVLLPLRKSLKFLGLALCLVFFQTAENSIDEYDGFELHVFDSSYNLVFIQDDNQNMLYIPLEVLKDNYVLDNIISAYAKYHNIKHIDNLIISGQAKSKISLEHLHSVLPIKNIISNIGFDRRDSGCSYSDNFKLGNSEIRFFGLEDSCSASVSADGDETFIFANMQKSKQSQFRVLYARMLKPKTIITNSNLSLGLLKSLKPDYYIYISDKAISSKYFKLLQEEGVDVFDTYNNGAISVRYIDDGISFESELKNY